MDKEPETEEKELVAEPFDKDEDWKTDKFDYFIMKASSKDQFEKGAQVYFCYGRLSNRLMLLRYGCALEWNKYDHVHLKVPYTDEFKNNSYIKDKVIYFRMNKWKRFKLRRISFCTNLVDYCKATFFNINSKHTIDMLLTPSNPDLELLGLHKAKSLLEEFLASFSHTLEENEQQLKDPNVFYHDYFAIVYKIERQRVAYSHLNGVNVLIEIIGRLKKGVTGEFSLLRVHDLETDEEYHRNRVFLQNYTLRLLKYYKK